jgi:hypothetical protein
VVALLAAVALLAGNSHADLRIAVWPQGPQGQRRVWTLRCAPTGGTLPNAAAACERLSRFAANPFAPVPPRTACTDIYGGPEEALVTGTFRQWRIWARFNRRDGCQIARWKRIGFLLVTA